MKIIRVSEPISNRRTGYECAAWWQESISDTGEFEIKLQKGLGGEPHYTVLFPATVTKDNFQSLWCGNMIGKPYNETQNAGQRTEFYKLFQIDAFVTDPRFIVNRENIDEWCNTVMEVLGARYTFCREWLMRKLTNHETFTAPQTEYDVATPTKLMNVTLERLRMVTTFRNWHKNAWRGQEANLPVYRDAVWYGYKEANSGPPPW